MRALATAGAGISPFIIIIIIIIIIINLFYVDKT